MHVPRLGSIFTLGNMISYQAHFPRQLLFTGFGENIYSKLGKGLRSSLSRSNQYVVVGVVGLRQISTIKGFTWPPQYRDFTYLFLFSVCVCEMLSVVKCVGLISFMPLGFISIGNYFNISVRKELNNLE